MKSFISFLVTYFMLLLASTSFGQSAQPREVVVTGVRFAYPLLERWIDEYKKENPHSVVRIEPRTNIDPASYDLLLEAYEPSGAQQETREYLYLARYVLLPVANAQSPLATAYKSKGLTLDLIRQIYFNDITTDKKKRIDPSLYRVYTRLQKAGAPITFAQYFGFEQANIKGKAIAGADEHLITSLLKDTLGITYSVPSQIYDLKTRAVRDGLTVLPVDTDNNGRLDKDENIYSTLDDLLAATETKSLKNIPSSYLHVSLRKNNENPEALKFIRWVIAHGQADLHAYGFLLPERARYEQEKQKFETAVIN